MELALGTSSGLRFINQEDRTLFEGSVVAGLVADGENLLTIVDGRSLQRIARDSVEELARSEGGSRLNCALPTASGILVGASGARLLRLEDGTLRPLLGFDSAEGRDEWFTPWGGPPDVRSLALAPNGTLFANVHVGGILRSDDDGASWRPTIDITSDVHQVVAGETPELLVAATAWGLATSEDGGDNWITSTSGLHADYCRAVALMDGVVFLSASVGPHGGRSAIYRRELAGPEFEKCSHGLPEWFGDNIDTGCLVVSGNEVAFGMSDGSVFSSRDSGSSWEQLAEGLPAIRSVAALKP